MAEAAARLVAARFVARPNRFIVRARLGHGSEVKAHLADPGRLEELLLPGAPLRLRPAPPSSTRKTRYTVALVQSPQPPRAWVSVETARANDLAETVLRNGSLRCVGTGWNIRREVRCGNSRFDFLLEKESEKLWVEVKSVTYAERGIARFPDAPTARGRRHVEELVNRIRAGDRALVLFLVQRGDVRFVTPHTEIDPAFTDVLRSAKRSGLLVAAARFAFDIQGAPEYRGTVRLRL